MSKLQAGASAPVFKNKKGSPSRRVGVKRRKLLFTTKNREALSLFSAKLVIGIIFIPPAHPGPPGRGPIWNRQLFVEHTFSPESTFKTQGLRRVISHKCTEFVSHAKNRKSHPAAAE